MPINTYGDTYGDVYGADPGGSGGGTYDLGGTSYDALLTYDGGTTTAPPTPSAPAPAAPFATSRLYAVETRTKTGVRVATIPGNNLQFEFLLNEPGNCRFSVPIDHPKVTRNNIEEGVHEVWVWRRNVLIYAGPIWQIATNSDRSALQVESQGLLSYFKHRVIDKTMLWNDTTNTGPGIATYIVMWTQDRAHGALGITVPAGYGGLEANIGTILGYKLSYRWWERKKIYDAINDLGDNVTTGFDYEVTPERVFIPYQPKKGSKLHGLLQYPTHFRSYYIPRYGQSISNDDATIGPGDGESTLIGYASDWASQVKYGLMQSTNSWGDAKTRASLNARSKTYVHDHKTPTAIPLLTLRGDAGPFLGTYSPGDSPHIQISNGYDQYDKVVRINGFQLTVGSNDEETVNVYLDLEEATI